MIAGVVVNLHYAPQSRLAYKHLMVSAISENPIGFIEERRFIREFPGYVIYMGDRDGPLMKDFWIWELDDEKRVKLFLRAKEGEINFDKTDNALVLTLRDGTAEQRDDSGSEGLADEPMRSLFFGELPIELPMGKIFGEKSQRQARIKEMTFSQLMVKRDLALAEETEAAEGISKNRMKVQMHMQKSFRDGVLGVFIGYFRCATCDSGRAKRELCEPGNRTDHCDDVLFPNYRSELVGGRPCPASRSIDLAAQSHFPGSWLLFDPTCQSALNTVKVYVIVRNVLSR